MELPFQGVFQPPLNGRKETASSPDEGWTEILYSRFQAAPFIFFRKCRFSQEKTEHNLWHVFKVGGIIYYKEGRIRCIDNGMTSVAGDLST